MVAVLGMRNTHDIAAMPGCSGGDDRAERARTRGLCALGATAASSRAAPSGGSVSVSDSPALLMSRSSRTASCSRLVPGASAGQLLSSRPLAVGCTRPILLQRVRAPAGFLSAVAPDRQRRACVRSPSAVLRDNTRETELRAQLEQAQQLAEAQFNESGPGGVDGAAVADIVDGGDMQVPGAVGQVAGAVAVEAVGVAGET
jgi:hypothetical protein